MWYKISTVYLIVSMALVGKAQIMTDFSLENLDDELVYLSDLQGESLTIIDFWATWCKPCTKAMPKLNELHNKYKEKGVTLVGISCDGPRSIGKVSPIVKSMNINYPILKDINCEVMNDYQFQAFPTLIILDQNRDIVWYHEGFSAGDELKIEEAILERL